MPRGHVKQDGPPSRRTVWTGRAGRPFCRGGTETARGAAGEPRAAGGRREAGGKGGPGPRGGHEPGALGGRWARQRAAGRAALCSPRPTTRRRTSSALRTHPRRGGTCSDRGQSPSARESTSGQRDLGLGPTPAGTARRLRPPSFRGAPTPSGACAR